MRSPCRAESGNDGEDDGQFPIAMEGQCAESDDGNFIEDEQSEDQSSCHQEELAEIPYDICGCPLPSEDGHQDCKRDDSDILREEDSEAASSMRHFNLTAFHEYSENDSGAAERNHSSDGDSFFQWETEREGYDNCAEESQCDLNHPAEERFGSELPEAIDREFEAEAEEEECDSEFRDGFDFMFGTDSANTSRSSEQHSGEEIADDGALSEAGEYSADQKRRTEQDYDVADNCPEIHVVPVFHPIRSGEGCSIDVKGISFSFSSGGNIGISGGRLEVVNTNRTVSV